MVRLRYVGDLKRHRILFLVIRYLWIRCKHTKVIKEEVLELLSLYFVDNRNRNHNQKYCSACINQ